jgi:hypothetical protein
VAGSRSRFCAGTQDSFQEIRLIVFVGFVGVCVDRAGPNAARASEQKRERGPEPFWLDENVPFKTAFSDFSGRHSFSTGFQGEDDILS